MPSNATLVAAVFLAGFASTAAGAADVPPASPPASPAPRQPTEAERAARRQRRLLDQGSPGPTSNIQHTQVEYVSADVKAKTMTFIDVERDTNTWPVEGEALKKAGSYKAGDRLAITWRSNPDGRPAAIMDIAKAVVPSPAPADMMPGSPEMRRRNRNMPPGARPSAPLVAPSPSASPGA